MNVLNHGDTGYRARKICVAGYGCEALVTSAGFAILSPTVVGLERDYVRLAGGVEGEIET